MKFALPVILLAVAVASFLMFTNPSYQDIKTLRVQSDQYNEALSNSRKLQEQRDALGQKYRSIAPESLTRLSKLLPDNADNIRLIIDIQQMAQNYGLSLSDIKFDANQEKTKAAAASGLAAGSQAEVSQNAKPYGIFNLEFSVTSNYENFMKFLKDLESSLRLTDVDSIEFSTESGGLDKTQFKYTIKLRTYWLKG